MSHLRATLSNRLEQPRTAPVLGLSHLSHLSTPLAYCSFFLYRNSRLFASLYMFRSLRLLRLLKYIYIKCLRASNPTFEVAQGCSGAPHA